jgi:hypothetical protein
MFIISVFPSNDNIVVNDIERDDDIKDRVRRFLEEIKKAQQVIHSKEQKMSDLKFCVKAPIVSRILSEQSKLNKLIQNWIFIKMSEQRKFCVYMIKGKVRCHQIVKQGAETMCHLHREERLKEPHCAFVKKNGNNCMFRVKTQGDFCYRHKPEAKPEAKSEVEVVAERVAKSGC